MSMTIEKELDIKKKENNDEYYSLNVDKKHHCGILTDGQQVFEKPKPI